MLDQCRHRPQAPSPRAVSWVVNHKLVRTDPAVRPELIGPEPVIDDAQLQFGASLGSALNLPQCSPEIGRGPVECVQQELVIWDRRRHPVCLRIDCDESAPRHDNHVTITTSR